MSYATKSELLIMDLEDPEDVYKVNNSIKFEKCTGMVSIFFDAPPPKSTPEIEIKNAFIAFKNIPPDTHFMTLKKGEIDMKFNNINFVSIQRNFYWNPLKLRERISMAWKYFKWLSIENKKPRAKLSKVKIKFKKD